MASEKHDDATKHDVAKIPELKALRAASEELRGLEEEKAFLWNRPRGMHMRRKCVRWHLFRFGCWPSACKCARRHLFRFGCGPSACSKRDSAMEREGASGLGANVPNAATTATTNNKHQQQQQQQHQHQQTTNNKQ